jgi:hypothetical protein
MRVLYGAFYYDNLWKIAEHLKAKYDWQPVYWFGGCETEKQVEEIFPGIVFQDYLLARRAIHSNRLKDLHPPVIDQDLIDALSQQQIAAMKVMYRCDATGTSFTVNDLITHYYDVIKFWLTAIHECKPEAVVFWINPHGVDYILYLLCKHLKIPILYLDCAYCISSDTHLITSSIENKAEILYQKYRDEKESWPPDEKTLQQIERQRGDYSLAKPDYMSEVGIWKQKGRSVAGFFWQLKQFLSVLKSGPFEKIVDHFKFHPGSYRSEKSAGTRWEHYLYQRRLSRNGTSYKKIYSQMVVPFDANQKYIYFAAPYQPEGTTLPDAGVYDNLVLVLEMLSANLPKDWIIYYKEHPATFDSTLGGDLYRGQEFYDAIAAIPNVKFVDYRTDTFSMIDQSAAVATITGSVGWEALVRGKPCIAFGQVWYLPCNGVFLIHSETDLKNAMSAISGGFKPSLDELLRFAGVIDHYCVKDLRFRNFQTRQKEIPNLEKELVRYAEAFYQAFQRYYPAKVQSRSASSEDTVAL